MNFENFVNGKIFEVFNFIYKLLLINSLWLLTTILGLGIFTFMPATVALYVLIQSVINHEEVPIIKTFFKIFKNQYFKAQKIFIVLLVIGVVLIIDFYLWFNFAGQSNNFLTTIGIVICFVILLLYALISTHICIVCMYYPHVKLYRTFKLAFLISMLYSFKTLFVIIINLVILLIIYLFPFLYGIAPLIFMSITTYISLSLFKPNYLKLVKDQEILSVKQFM